MITVKKKKKRKSHIIQQRPYFEKASTDITVIIFKEVTLKDWKGLVGAYKSESIPEPWKGLSSLYPGSAE